jgi:hypothetical protein
MIRTRDPSNQAAADLRLRPRGYRGRHHPTRYYNVTKRQPTFPIQPQGSYALQHEWDALSTNTKA